MSKMSKTNFRLFIRPAYDINGGFMSFQAVARETSTIQYVYVLTGRKYSLFPHIEMNFNFPTNIDKVHQETLN